MAEGEDNGKRSTPLHGFEGGEALRLSELPRSGKVIFRGEPDGAFRDAFREVTGAALPLKPNSTEQNEARLVIWMGPNEWMVRCPPEQVEPLVKEAEGKMAGMHAAAVDVSDYYTVVGIGGEHALAALSHGCPLDLHPAAFPVGACAQTRFDSAPVLIRKTGDDPEFEIQVRWSFAGHVWNLLADLSREYEGEGS